jgi:high-affinity iron transporter
VGELVLVGWIPALVDHIWDLSVLVSSESLLGQTLGALFGYSADPSLMQVLAYCAYFVVILLGLQATGNQRHMETKQAAQ